MIQRSARLAFWAFVANAMLAGCASIDSSDYKQTILVTSDPPGAAVYENGVKLGVTPGFVRVRRKRRPVLTYELPGQKAKTLHLRTKYRWGDSFAANFVMLSWAPIGWGIDWATGTMWKMEDPGLAKFDGARGNPLDVTPKNVAVAPPAIDDHEVSEALGDVIENRLRATEKFSVMNYEKTAPAFGYYDSDQGLAEKQVPRYNLLHELKADHVFTSTVEPKDDKFEIRGELKNAYSGKTLRSYRWEIQPEDAGLRADLTSHRKYYDFFKLLPNTIFFNFSAYTPRVTIDEQEYQGKSARGNGFTEQMWDYLTSLSFSHLERPRLGLRGHWYWELAPAFVFSQRKIEYTGYLPLEDVQFERWVGSTGLGGEVGHKSRYGNFYLQIIPMGTWTQIYSKAHVGSETITQKISRHSVQTLTELGYQYFFTNHLVGKIYLRSLSEDDELWERAIKNVTSRDGEIESAFSNFTGIAIGYYIPSSFRKKDGWKVTPSN